MSKKDKKLCTVLNYIKRLLISASNVTRCFSISHTASLLHIPAGNESSTAGMKIYAITAPVKRCNSLIKKMKKIHDRIVLLPKTKFNTIDVLISNA